MQIIGEMEMGLYLWARAPHTNAGLVFFCIKGWNYFKFLQTFLQRLHLKFTALVSDAGHILHFQAQFSRSWNCFPQFPRTLVHVRPATFPLFISALYKKVFLVKHFKLIHLLVTLSRRSKSYQYVALRRHCRLSFQKGVYKLIWVWYKSSSFCKQQYPALFLF